MRSKSSKADPSLAQGGYAEPVPPPATLEVKQVERSLGKRMRDRSKPEEQSPTAPEQDIDPNQA